MDETIKQEQNYDGTNEETHKDEEYDEDNNHVHRMRESESHKKLKKNKTNIVTQNKKMRSNSRSRSPLGIKNNRQWISSNAFINFVQDFRRSHAGVRSTTIYQMADKRWQEMSPEEKQPYVKAALSVKNRKKFKEKVQNVQKLDTDPNTDNTKNVDSTNKQEKVGKKEVKKKPKRKYTKKKNKSDSDCDSMTSCTTGSNTSDELSDDSL